MVIGILGGSFNSTFLINSKKNNYIFLVFDKNINCSASICAKIFLGNFNNLSDINEFYKNCDVVIINSNKINTKILNTNKFKAKTLQNPMVFDMLKTRISQKKIFDYLDINHSKGFLLNKNYDFFTNNIKYRLPLVFKKNAFDNNQDLNIDWIQKFSNIQEIKKAKKYFKNNKKNGIIVEDYVKWIGQFTLTCFRDNNNKNYVCSYNWTLYHNNGLFIVQPNYVKKKILHDSQIIMNKLLDFFNSQGVYTIKFYVTKKDKIIVNYVTHLTSLSGDQALYNFKYSQYDYLLSIIDNSKIINNEKVKNYALMLIIDRGYNQKNIKALKSEKKIIFYDFKYKYLANKKGKCYGFFFLPRNPNNSYIMRHWVNELMKNYKASI